jgi:hypothetical protein
VVFSGAPAIRSGGATNSQSGDRNWWFDFSSVTRGGEYYVYDPSTDARSARFRIGTDVYEEVMKHAVRMFYYQRRGAAKTLPYADARWTDGTNFMGPLQDTQCRLITNPTLATQKDLRGGWFDDRVSRSRSACSALASASLSRQSYLSGPKWASFILDPESETSDRTAPPH